MTQGRRRALRDERGQVTMALVMTTVVALIAVALFGVLAVSRGADERTQAQTAADAAALAGVDAVPDVLSLLFGTVDEKGDLGRLALGCDLGRAQAQIYASQNGASLKSYCFNASTGRAEVVVEMNDRVSDDIGPAEAGAKAQSGFARSSCSWRDDEPDEPEPTPTPTEEPEDDEEPTPPPPPPPPPNWTTTLTCGAFEAVFSVDGETGKLTLSSVDVTGLEPKLVG